MDSVIQSMIENRIAEIGIYDKRVVHEVLQQVVLAGLYRSGFFDKAAFYGGTCLRLFHGLDRFSEDMDFSLLRPAQDFDLADYFDAVVSEFALAGCKVEIHKKKKTQATTVESAFLKSDTSIYSLETELQGAGAGASSSASSSASAAGRRRGDHEHGSARRNRD